MFRKHFWQFFKKKFDNKNIGKNNKINNPKNLRNYLIKLHFFRKQHSGFNISNIQSWSGNENSGTGRWLLLTKRHIQWNNSR